MAVSARFEAVRDLLSKRGLLVPLPRETPGDGEIAREPDAIATGIEAIDALLPGGFPRRAISEIAGPEACGKTSLVMAAVATVTRARRLAAWIDPAGEGYPPAFAKAGVELSRLLWVRSREALWSAEVLAQSGAFDLVVLDATRLSFLPQRKSAEPRDIAVAKMMLERRGGVLRNAVEASGVALVVLAREENETERGVLGVAPALRLALALRGRATVQRSRWGGIGRVSPPVSLGG